MPFVNPGQGTIPFQIARGDRFSDMQLRCDESDFPAHRVIVCNASPVISNVMEEDTEENYLGVYSITNFSKTTVERMLSFIYTGDYDVKENFEEMTMTDGAGSLAASQGPENSKPLAAKELLRHVSVNAIGHAYEVQGLCELSSQKISAILSREWDPKWFSPFVKLCYDHTSNQHLQNVLVHKAVENLDNLLLNDRFAELEVPASFFKEVLFRVAEKKRQDETKLAEARRRKTLKNRHKRQRYAMNKRARVGHYANTAAYRTQNFYPRNPMYPQRYAPPPATIYPQHYAPPPTTTYPQHYAPAPALCIRGRADWGLTGANAQGAQFGSLAPQPLGEVIKREPHFP